MSQLNERQYSRGQTDELRQQIAALSRRQAELTALYEVGKELASTLDPNQLLELILDRAITLVQAERGFLVLWDEASKDFEIAVARQFEPRERDDAEAEISRRLIQNVLTHREPVITTNAQEDPRFVDSESIVTYSIRSVLAAPLIFKIDLIGAIYVDTRIERDPGRVGQSRATLHSRQNGQFYHPRYQEPFDCDQKLCQIPGPR